MATVTELMGELPCVFFYHLFLISLLAFSVLLNVFLVEVGAAAKEASMRGLEDAVE